MKDDNVGIIGYGKMGKLLAREFSEDHSIGIFSKDELNTNHAVFDSLEKLYRNSTYLVLTIPSQEVQKTLKKLSSLDTEDEKVIFDISTFKEDIIDLYCEFPSSVRVASVHPLFGPGIGSIKSENVILVPVKGREEDADHIEEFFESFQADVSRMDVEKHDDLMSITIGVPYFLGISYLRLISRYEDLQEDPDMYKGTSFDYLSNYGKAVLKDSPEFIKEVFEHSGDKIEEMFEMKTIETQDIQKLKSQHKEEIEESYSRLYEVFKKQ